MMSCPEAIGWDSWVFWKKHLVEIWDWTKGVGIRIWAWPVQLFAAGCVCVCWVSELRADAGRTVSIVKIVCLSPRVENLKVKKVIKVSYLNLESRQCFAGFLYMHIFYISVDLYILYICILWLYYTAKYGFNDTDSSSALTRPCQRKFNHDISPDLIQKFLQREQQQQHQLHWPNFLQHYKFTYYIIQSE